MTVSNRKQIFLGWDAPVVDKVCDWLVERVPTATGEPLDLGKLLIVVPTAHAGRRLREALALHCDRRGTALLAARMVTPAFFLRNTHDKGANEVPPAVAKAIWAKLLLDIDLSEYAGLFPAGIPERDYGWALHTGDMFQRLRLTLSDAGLLIGDVPAAAAGELEEAERWTDMGRLEQVYLRALNAMGYLDPVQEQIRRANDPELPEGVAGVVLAAVPDPTKLMLDALKALDRKGAPIDILVHAPVGTDTFDDWGIPITGVWINAAIDIPGFEANVQLAAGPESQAELALEAIAGCADTIGPADIAIGVPDHSVAPFLESRLSAAGIPAFDPAEKEVSDHALFRLLDSFCALYGVGSYQAFADLLRHPELLHYFESECELSTYQLLKDLDEFQNAHLPMDFDAVIRQFHDGVYTGVERGGFEALGRAIVFVRARLAALAGDLEDGIRGLLRTVYGARKVIGDSPAEKELEAVAAAVDGVLRECTEAAAVLGPAGKDGVALFLERLSDESYACERDRAVIDLEGWLELPWNNAPLVIVTGMNEGAVPDSRLGDVFVPDRLRKAIGLSDDAGRFARDIYLLADIIASRPPEGKVVLIAGRTSAVGDPLKPSRLLFRCNDADLLGRAGHLLGDVQETRRNHAFNRSFLLDPAAPIVADPGKPAMKHLSATQFAQYLACPFRFYLKNIVGMRALNDEKVGLEAADFGTMLHWVLEVLAEDETLRACSDENTLAAALHARLDKWAESRFGDEPPLTIKIAVESARQRLTHAARVQAEQVRQGWIIDAKCEERLVTKINGFVVSGRIDRIDRHRETGLLRVVDYKTGNTGAEPKTSHITSSVKNCSAPARFRIVEKGKEKEYAWRDLQLPLYSLMVQERAGAEGPVSAAYFNLPKAVTTTAVREWSGMDENIVAAARHCAGMIIDAISEKRFWPPSDNVAFDDFEAITTGTLAETVDGDRFKAFLGI